MNDLTPKQINDLGKLAELIDGGEVAVLKEINDLSNRVDSATEIASNALKIASETSKQAGDAGYTPIKGIDYEDGHDYVLTEIDKKEIASKIKVPIVEKVIEKIEVIHEQPIVREKEIIKETIKEPQIINKELSPQEIRDSLELLSDDERLDAKYVKGIKNYDAEVATLQNRTQLLVQLNGGIDRRVSTLESNPVSSGSGWTVSTPSGSLYDQVTETGGTSFTSVGTAQIVWADGGTYFNGAGCTISGTSITMDNPVTQWIRVGV